MVCVSFNTKPSAVYHTVGGAALPECVTLYNRDLPLFFYSWVVAS